MDNFDKGTPRFGLNNKYREEPRPIVMPDRSAYKKISRPFQKRIYRKDPPLWDLQSHFNNAINIY